MGQTSIEPVSDNPRPYLEHTSNSLCHNQPDVYDMNKLRNTLSTADVSNAVRPCLPSSGSCITAPPPLPPRDGSLLSQASYWRLHRLAISIEALRLPGKRQKIIDLLKPQGLWSSASETFQKAFDPYSFEPSSQKSLGEILYLAAYVGDEPTVRSALSSRAYPDYPIPELPDCPLNAALAFEYDNVVEMLFEAGASLSDLAKALGSTEQQLMARVFIHHTRSIVNICLKYRGKDAFPPESGLIACTRSQPDILELLHRYNFDFTVRYSQGACALHVAAQYDSPSAGQFLLDRGFPIEGVDYLGRTALHYAATHTSHKTVEFLLRNKAQINPVDQAGDTPMHCLILHAINAEGRDQSAWVLQPMKVTIMEQLWSAGATLDVADNTGERPLHIAIRRCLYLLAARLISLGSDPEAPNREGFTPLHLCARGDERVHVWIAQELIEKAANVEARVPVPDKRTPLDLANQAQVPNAETIRLLTVAGRN